MDLVEKTVRAVILCLVFRLTSLQVNEMKKLGRKALYGQEQGQRILEDHWDPRRQTLTPR